MIQQVHAVRLAESEATLPVTDRDSIVMDLAHSRATRFRRTLYWLALPVCLVVWAYLRLKLGWPAPVDALVLIALFAEAALILGRHPAR